MLDVVSSAMVTRVDLVVREFLKGSHKDCAVAPDQNLEDFGLTSIDMVNLMLAIEAEFDLTIPGSKLIPANFKTLERIVGLVEELRG